MMKGNVKLDNTRGQTQNAGFILYTRTFSSERREIIALVAFWL